MLHLVWKLKEIAPITFGPDSLIISTGRNLIEGHESTWCLSLKVPKFEVKEIEMTILFFMKGKMRLIKTIT